LKRAASCPLLHNFFHFITSLRAGYVKIVQVLGLKNTPKFFLVKWNCPIVEAAAAPMKAKKELSVNWLEDLPTRWEGVAPGFRLPWWSVSGFVLIYKQLE
jgi:hypothetical protein